MNTSATWWQNIVIKLDTNPDIELGPEPEVDLEDSKVGKVFA